MTNFLHDERRLPAAAPGAAASPARADASACWLATLILIVLMMLAPASGRAAAPERWSGLADTVFQNYTPENGLPNPIATAITEDRDGFLWVGTQNGLSRWDGNRFRIYRPRPDDPGALPDNWVTALHVDTRGRLWIGTSAGGLARYDPKQDNFISYRVGPDGLKNIAVNAIAGDGKGSLWIGTGAGLDLLDPAQGVVKPQPPSGLPSGPVHALLRDRAGTLWVGTGAGLYYRESGEKRFTAVALAGLAQPPAISSLYRDKLGQLWIGTRSHGGYRLKRGAGQALPITDAGHTALSGQGQWIYAIAAAGPGEVWLGTYGQGILAVDIQSGRSRPIRHDATLPSSLEGDIIFSMFSDRTGVTWVGSHRGLSRHDSSQRLVTTLFGDSRRQDGIRGADIFAVRPDSSGRVWLGLQGKGIDVITPASATVLHIAADRGDPMNALPEDHVFDIAEAPDGAMFAATGRGLYRMDRDGGNVRRIEVASRHPAASTYRLLIRQSDLWIGGRDDGVWVVPLNRPGVTSRHIRPDQLSDGRITALRQGVSNEMWIGTRNGLNRFDLATAAIEKIVPDKSRPSALAAGTISGLLIDRRNRLWVGTLGGGVHLLNGRDGAVARFRRIGVEQGMPSENVDQLLMAADGQIWASTADGIASIADVDPTVRRFDAAEGLAIRGYWIGSGAVTAEGELLFGGEGGLAIIHPEQVSNQHAQPPMVVTDIQLGGRPVAPGLFNQPENLAPLIISPAANSIAVEFAALDYAAAKRLRYRHRLDGFEPGWIETDASRRIATYTNLPPGDYTLYVENITHAAAGERAGRARLALPITVLPAWYQSTWFKLLCALAAGLAMLAVVQARTAFLRRRQRVLEGRVAERTMVLEQTAAELREANHRLFELATTDSLTGCLNRRHFLDRAKEFRAQSRRNGQPLTLLIFDLDHFKHINDRHGHPAGDEVLRTTVRVAQGELRTTDALGRMGGEEFALLMPNTDAAGAFILAERLRHAIALIDIVIDNERVRITASMGLAVMLPDEAFETLYARVDVALYAAKNSGRNRTVVGVTGAAAGIVDE